MDSFQQMMQLMRSEADEVARLLDILREESDKLVSRDAAALGELASRKQALLERLEQSELQRRRLLQQAGQPADKDGLEAFLAQAPDALKSQWQQLKESLEACRKRNRINGQVLDTSRRDTQQALSILLGDKAKPETELYGKNGSTVGGHRSHSFTKA